MIAAIKYNLANLANFTGRDTRSTFWWYILFLVLLNLVVGLVISIPMYVEMFNAAFDAVQDGADPAELNAAMAANIGGSIKTVTYLGSGLTFLLVGLFAASFVRRLHDSGKPGWIVVLALAPVLYTAVMNSLRVDDVIAMTQAAMGAANPEQALGDQTRIYFASIIGWAGYLVTLIFGVLESDDGPNKYGPEPTPLD